MSNREKARRAEQARRSYTIDEWCLQRRISRAMFYKMAAQGLGPRTHYAGSKPLISDEADAAWIREREAEAESTAA